jgi:hypothetical protein
LDIVRKIIFSENQSMNTRRRNSRIFKLPSFNP